VPISHRPVAVNRLIAALPAAERERFLARCEPATLAFADVIVEPGAAIEQVYFPTDSLISQMAPIKGRPGLEVGLVGNEGMQGISLLLGVGLSPLRAVVQHRGMALRMDAAQFGHEIERSTALRCLLQHYLHVRIGWLAQAAVCNRFHPLEARLARRLLVAQDRAHTDSFHMTHEYLAYLLGTRRVGITQAAGALQERKLIRYHRGSIRILDRHGLEAASCDCLRVDNLLYTRIMALPCK